MQTRIENKRSTRLAKNLTCPKLKSGGGILIEAEKMNQKLRYEISNSSQVPYQNLESVLIGIK